MRVPDHAPPPDAMSAAEAAVRLGMTDSNVRRMLAAGTLSGWPPRSESNPSGGWLVERASVERIAVDPPKVGRPRRDTARGDTESLSVHLALAESRVTELELARRDDEMARLRDQVERLGAENDSLRAELAQAWATVEAVAQTRRITAERSPTRG